MNDKLFVGINRAVDTDNLTDLEKKHLPAITAPSSVKARESFAVTIMVGKALAHPDLGEHFIQYVELLCDDNAFLARVDLTPTITGTPVTLTVKLNYNTTLKARARCNQHGIWETEQAITVS